MTSKEDVIECFETTLKNLQTDYLDLYLVYNYNYIVHNVLYNNYSIDSWSISY